VKPGKGGAFVRSTLKNLRTGKVLENTVRAGEKVETVRVERRKYQYLFSEGDSLVCMDNESYEQINIPRDLFSDGVKFLKESEEVEILFNGSDIISVDIPIFINLKLLRQSRALKAIPLLVHLNQLNWKQVLELVSYL
jgi:elongation factor P